MAYCKQCGNELMPDSSFCSYCGAPVSQEPIPASDDLPSVIPDTSPVPDDSPVDAAPPVPTEPPADVEPSVSIEPPADVEPLVFSESPADVEPPISAESQAAQTVPVGFTASTPEVPLAETPPVPPAYFAPPAPFVAPADPYSVPDKSRSGFGRITFANSFLTIMLLGIFLTVAVVLGSIGSPYFFNFRSFDTLFVQFCMLSIIALAAVLSSRAKGPDLSIGYLMMFSGVIVAQNFTTYGSPFIAMLIAVAVCANIGLLNGVLINYAGIPALIVTLMTGLAVRYVGFLLTNNEVVAISGAAVTSVSLPLLAIVLLSIAFVAAFFMILPSKLGTPVHKREKRHPVSYMFAYMLSGVIAALAGILMLYRIRGVYASYGNGYELLILLVYGCVAGSRVFDNRIAPALYAFAPALLYVTFAYTMSLLSIDAFIQSMVYCVLVLVFLLVAYLVRPELRRNFPAPKQ